MESFWVTLCFLFITNGFPFVLKRFDFFFGFQILGIFTCFYFVIAWFISIWIESEREAITSFLPK
jgi:hypothetical protein